MTINRLIKELLKIPNQEMEVYELKILGHDIWIRKDAKLYERYRHGDTKSKTD